MIEGRGTEEMPDPSEAADRTGGRKSYAVPRFWWILVLVLIPIVLIASLESLGSQSGEIDPKSIALSADDVPPGLQVRDGSSRYLDNALAAQGDDGLLSQFRITGRLTGYEIAFDAASLSDNAAFFNVQNNVSVFKDANGASAMMEILQESTPEDLQEIKLSGLGDQHFAAESGIIRSAGAPDAVFRVVAIRKGRVVASLAAASLPSTTMDQVAQIAQRLATRIP